MGSDPALYRQLFDDPRYLTAVINTLLYVGIGVNLKMALAFLLSGFFMRKGWWVKAVLVIFILPWATPALPAYMSIHWFLNGQWGMLNNVLYELTGIDGPVYLNSHWMGLAANIGAYIWKNLPFWTLILLSGRMAIPQELYEAAAVDGASGLRSFDPCNSATDGEPVHRLRAARYRLRARRFQCHLLRLRRGPGDVDRGAGHARHPLCLYGFPPRLGVAEVMTALPVLIPLIFILMRKLRMSEQQL